MYKQSFTPFKNGTVHAIIKEDDIRTDNLIYNKEPIVSIVHEHKIIFIGRTMYKPVEIFMDKTLFIEKNDIAKIMTQFIHLYAPIKFKHLFGYKLLDQCWNYAS